MKASASPRTLYAVMIAVVATCAALRAQDVVVQKNGQRSEGQISALVDGRIKIKVGPVETTIPFDQVVSVTKPAPKAYDDSLNSWQKGDAAQTLTTLKPLVDSFRGLPTPWAERASALLGDVYLSLGQVPDAETAFTAFQKAYPASTSLADLGLARLAVEKKDYVTAKAKLEPIVAEASQTVMAPTGKNAIYGQAFYLMGMVHEGQEEYPQALHDYLSTVTIFSEDQAVVAKAQQRADALKAKNVIVP